MRAIWQIIDKEVKNFEKYSGTLERILRAIVIIPVAILFFTGIIGYCPGYELLNFSTK
jgi:hypothetical protein